METEEHQRTLKTMKIKYINKTNNCKTIENIKEKLTVNERKRKKHK